MNNKYATSDVKTPEERRIYDGTYSKQDTIDIDWAVTEKRAMIALFLYYFISCSKFLNILSSKNSVIVISSPSHNFNPNIFFENYQFGYISIISH